MTGEWRTQYEEAAQAESALWTRASDRDLLERIRSGKTGSYYGLWREVGSRRPTPETCWLLYDVLNSARPYLDRYHCADALLKLIGCREFEPVQLSAGWPVVRENLARLRGLVEAAIGSPVGVPEGGLGVMTKSHQAGPLKTLQAGLLYFAIVLGCGFLLGMFRVPFLVPRIGERWAELAEMPVMAVVIFLGAGFVLRRFPATQTAARSLVVGVVALTLTVLAELGLALALQSQTLAEFIGSRDKVSGSVYLLLLVVFALMPRLRLRRLMLPASGHVQA